VRTSDTIWKAKDMRHDPRVALPVIDSPTRTGWPRSRDAWWTYAPDEDCRPMDPISVKYTSVPFASRGPDRVCFLIAVDKAAQRALCFVHDPGLLN
jgi:hypothetical protein